MTYNMHHANPPSKPELIDMQAIAKVINSYQPDLVALQEVDVNNRRSGESLDQAAELGKLTGMEHFFVKGIDYEGGAYGIAVLSRFPILKVDSLKLPMDQNSGGEPRVLAVITVETANGDSLLFACTHLDLKEENRMLQANAITAKFKDTLLPVIIGGDFNAKPGSDVINHFDEHFKRSSVPGVAAFTIPEKQPNREIDFIMYKPKDAFKPVKHEVVKEPYASDHLPVYVEFAYK
ncbi:endonuclease/exonuclease/phosphatase family protein [Olivibacter sp. SDN3]|nr:endonuclease/exonuclease/phosphatase family protein [Olivibacter sp. SDN3]